MSKQDPTHKTRPWRDNIEAVTMAIVMAVLLKYFVVEAYKIPTGSMQPTLLGNEETGIFDRILVDKLSYHFRDPKRWEVAVFRYPLDRSKNFIKRIVGMPGEYFHIRNGDLFARRSPEEEWQILRRPRSVQREGWKRLDSDENWRIEGGRGNWQIEGDSVVATGPGSVRFPRSGGSVMDRYADGYPGRMAEALRARGKGSGERPVGDLRIAGELEAASDCSSVTLEFREGRRAYELILPGPAAPADARPCIRVGNRAGSNGTRVEAREVFADEPWRLSADSRVDFAAQNMDDLLELEVDGDIIASLEIDSASDQTSAIILRTESGGAEFTDVIVQRDIYYTSDRAAVDTWPIPEGHYFMMGDNTQDSADSREWRFAHYEVVSGDEAGLHVRGNLRTNDNPRTVTGGEDGPEIFFRDEYGERHRFLAGETKPQRPVEAPFVSRELITGRALLVFWPFVPSLDVYRLQWIR